MTFVEKARLNKCKRPRRRKDLLMEVLIWCTALHSEMHPTPYHRLYYLQTCTPRNHPTAWQRFKSNSKTFQIILFKEGCVEPHSNISAVYRPRARSAGFLLPTATCHNQDNICLAVDGADGRQVMQLSHSLSSHCSRWLC